MLGSDTTMGLSWRWNTVGCTVEPLDGYGWFLGPDMLRTFLRWVRFFASLEGTKGDLGRGTHSLSPRDAFGAPMPCAAGTSNNPEILKVEGVP